MPASFVWQPGPNGGTPTNAANLNKLAVTADIGVAGTPTGDAGRAVFVPAVGDRAWLPTAPHPASGTTRTPITTFQSGHGWTATTGGAGTNVNNTASPPIGSQYATLATQGLGTGTPARITGTGLTVDLTGKTLWLLMRVSGVANLDNIQVYAGPAGFSSYYLFQLDRYTDTRTGAYWREGQWAWMPFSFENVSVTSGTPNKAAITDMRVTIVDHGGVVTADIAALATSPSASTFAWPNGVVSFTADDGWLSQYTAARPALDKYLFPATAYIIADAIDGTANIGGEGAMSLANLQTLQAANRWEIAAHASTLANHDAMFTTLGTAQLDAEFSAMKKWLHDRGFGGGDHLAFPQGAYNDTVMERVKNYFTSARAINSFARESYPAGDRHRFRAVGLTNGISLATAKGYVDSAKAAGAWLTIVVHKLGATADSLTWTTSDFQALVDYIAASNMPVRTVGQVLASRGEEAIRANSAAIATNTAAIAGLSGGTGGGGGGKVLATTAPTISPGVVNTTTETAIASLTVPAAQLLAGDLLIFDVAWDVLNNSGASVNFQYKLKVGAVTVGSTGQIAAGTSVQRVGARGKFHILLTALNAPRVWGEFTASFAAGGFGGINTAHAGILQPTAPAVDFSTDTIVQLTCTMGTASASADFRPVAASITRDR